MARIGGHREVLSSDSSYDAPDNTEIRNGKELSTPQSQSQNQSQSQTRIKPASAVYWLRALFGILAGVANQLLRIDQASFGDLAVYVAIGLGLVFYLLSIAIVRYVLHYGEVELKGKNRYITAGGGTYIVLWIMVSVLLYTLK